MLSLLFAAAAVPDDFYGSDKRHNPPGSFSTNSAWLDCFEVLYLFMTAVGFHNVPTAEGIRQY